MNKGNDYLIKYKVYGKNILATFTEEVDGVYMFKNITGLFGVTKKAIAAGLVSLELIED